MNGDFMNPYFVFWISSLKLIIRPQGYGLRACSLSKRIVLICSWMFGLDSTNSLSKIKQKKKV